MNPPHSPIGGRFVQIRYIRCPDCEYEGALRNDGGAKVVGGGQLRGATKEVGITRASSGCPTCRGRGSISTKDLPALLRAGIDNPRLASLDPYVLKSKPNPGNTGA